MYIGGGKKGDILINQELYLYESIDDLIQILNKNEIKLVILDIFDTVFLRPILNPDTIKAIISQCLEPDLKHIFIENRNAYELEIRKIKSCDVSIHDIYDHFVTKKQMSFENSSFTKNVEISIEKKLLKLRPDTQKIIKYLEEKKIDYVFASDMFLSKDIIFDSLNSNNIKNFKTLYISSEIGCRKDNGLLFHYILNEEKINPENVLVIGDNEQSDQIIPRNMGMNIFPIYRPYDIAKKNVRYSKLIEEYQKKPDVSSDIILGLVFNKIYSPLFHKNANMSDISSPNANSIGYTILGPIIVSFCQWLIEEGIKDNIDKFYFLSREGKIIKKIYDNICSKCYNSAPKSEYLVLSRRSVLVPGINSLNDILNIAQTHYLSGNIEDFLWERFGLSLTNNEWEQIYDKGFWVQGELVEINDGNILKILPLLNELQEKIIKRSNFEKAGINAYLYEKGITQDMKKAAVVDIGYSGTIQKQLSKLVNENINGYYLITTNEAYSDNLFESMLLKGYLGSQINKNDFLYQNSFILEKMMSSEDTQLLFYEYNSESKFKGIFRQKFLEDEIAIEPRNELQNGAIEFALDFIQSKFEFYPPLKVSPYLCFFLFEGLVNHPSRSDLETMEKLLIDDFYCGRKFA